VAWFHKFQSRKKVFNCPLLTTSGEKIKQRFTMVSDSIFLFANNLCCTSAAMETATVLVSSQMEANEGYFYLVHKQRNHQVDCGCQTEEEDTSLSEW
jgi:hypothetical protein